MELHDVAGRVQRPPSSHERRPSSYKYLPDALKAHRTSTRAISVHEVVPFSGALSAGVGCRPQFALFAERSVSINDTREIPKVA